MRQTIKIIICSLMLVLAFAPAFEAHGSLPQKRVLLLYSEDKAHPAHELTDGGIRAVFRSNKLFDVQLYSEYLDLSRFSRRGHTRAVTDYLGRKYAGLKIDAIITIYPAALDMLLGEVSAGFPGVPIVACEIDRNTAEKLERSPSRRLVTAVIVGDNIAPILDSAFRMRSGTKRVALVAGTSLNDAASERIFRKGLDPYAGKIDLIDLTKLPMQETLARVGSLPTDAIVLYAAIFKDGAGQDFVPREALSLISRAANAPVFGLYEPFLGYGIVGGRLLSFEKQGSEAATLALRIMGGESPASIPFGGEQAYVNLYDWRELKRWNIPETAVPPGSEIRYREPSLWRDYKGAIIGVIALIIIETFLILGLVINLRRRRKAEQSLIESENRLKLAVSSAGAGLWGVDVGTRRIWATDRTLELFGIATGEELTVEKVLGSVHPEDREGINQAVQLTLQSGRETVVDCRIVLPGGNVCWIVSRGRLHLNSAGVPSRVMGVSVDITDRKRDELALRESEERFRQVAENVGDFIWEVDTNGLYRYTSPPVEKILGYRPDELIGKRHFYDLFTPAVREELKAAAFKVFAAKQSFRAFPNTNVSKEGKVVYLETSGAPVLDAAGSLVGYRGADTDMTERQEMENKIKKAAEEWQTTFDSSQDLIFILDQDFKVVRVNAATLSFFKLPIERILGNPCYTLMHGTDEPPEICPFRGMMKTKRHEETEFYDRERNAWFQVSVDPILDGNGEIAGVVHRVQDITKRKQAEMEADRARNELLRIERSYRLSELSASLAHELNQPLAAILSNAQAALRFLQSDKPDLNEFREIVQDIIRDDQRAGNVIRSLRSMMKREEGEKRPTILNDILNDVIHIFHSEAIFRNVSIETEWDGSLPPVIGDKGQLQQVVLNLVMNAAEAMSQNPSEQRKLILRTQTKDHSIWVTVRDFGPGMDKENLERVFQPFFTTKGTGLGMGLAVCSSIIKDHGGRIWAENNPDGGATFFVELPLISDQ